MIRLTREPIDHHALTERVQREERQKTLDEAKKWEDSLKDFISPGKR